MFFNSEEPYLKLSVLVFPHTEQQYSKIGLIKALYSKFLSDKFRYFMALWGRFTLEFNLVIYEPKNYPGKALGKWLH